MQIFISVVRATSSVNVSTRTLSVVIASQAHGDVPANHQEFSSVSFTDSNFSDDILMEASVIDSQIIQWSCEMFNSKSIEFHYFFSCDEPVFTKYVYDAMTALNPTVITNSRFVHTEAVTAVFDMAELFQNIVIA